MAAAPKKEVKAAVAAPKTTTATAQGIASTTASKISFAGKKFSTDDLKIVEGIGPKIEELLHAGGIKTWNDLANATTERLQEILNEAGARYRVHNPSTWAKQAQLCVAGDWAGLEALQDRLDGGVDRGA
ncbi:MAG: helix-hairpin-helix domain-containing protein [Bacteroidota bacterium]